MPCALQSKEQRKEVLVTKTALNEEKILRRSRHAHVIVASVEALIKATMSGVFFTLLVKQLGVSDAVTGILSNVVSFGCAVQVFSAAFVGRLRSLRTGAAIFQTLKHLLYAFLYLLPFLPMPAGARIPVFAVVYALATVSGNLITPARFHWMMSFVRLDERGIFTAHKDMISLVLTIVYNLAMGRVVDHFTALGRPDIGLQLCAATIVILTVTDTVSLLRSADAPAVLENVRKTPSFLSSLRTNFSNRSFVLVILMGMAWNFFDPFSRVYHNVYLLQELECSVTFIVIAGMAGNLIRLALSVPMGRYADRFGFDRSVALGFGLAALSNLLLVFWRPENGAALYLIYQLPFAAALAALTGGLMNIIMQYVPPKDRVGAQGLYAATNGTLNFLGTLAGGGLLAMIQKNGNALFGISVYAQQVLSLVSALGMLVLVFYVRRVVEKLPRVE